MKHPIEQLESLAGLVVPFQDRHFSTVTPLSLDARIYCKGEAVIQPFVTVDGPIFLGEGVRIGPYSMLRGPLYIGDGVQIGPYCEVTRCIVGDRSIIAHKNIIPDTVIGNDVWIAGGVIVCNVRLDKKPVKFDYNGETLQAERFGALIEDGARLGVNVILMPATHVKAGASVLGPSTIKGTIQ